jgi:hypothetical protein
VITIIHCIFAYNLKPTVMKTAKLKSEMKTVQEFINYYNGAGRQELKAALKNIGNSRDISKKNEKQAIEALLA